MEKGLLADKIVALKEALRQAEDIEKSINDLQHAVHENFKIKLSGQYISLAEDVRSLLRFYQMLEVNSSDAHLLTVDIAEECGGYRQHKQWILLAITNRISAAYIQLFECRDFSEVHECELGI